MAVYDPSMPEAEATEVVDGLPVLHEPAPVPAERAAAPVAVQAAAVAGASFVAGATVVGLMRNRKARKAAMQVMRGRRRRKGQRLDVIGTRSFLVDVHFVDRR
jgi:hypothetical protein